MTRNGEVGREPIAVVGIGCRYPGGVRGVQAFWSALLEETDAISRVPSDRFEVEDYLSPDSGTPGTVGSPWGGFVEDIRGFDAAIFGISPREADRLDPQHRFLLESAWDALEDAGQPAPGLLGSTTGVFVGLWLNDYEARLFADPRAVDFHMTLGSGRYSAAGRISYWLGLEGPSLVVDTACSSSLVAVHLACRSLWTGECSMALAGGANAILQPHITIAYSGSGMMAPDGRCKFGDALADGYVRSEGCGVVVLKPLRRALAERDRIYALIRGGAVNNDGQSGQFLTTPSQVGQETMLRRAYEDAGAPAGRVRYVEAHGTGTRAGDPVEIGALGAVLGNGRPADEPCLVGSVKTNFGHTEGAAGVAGLIKSALILKHKWIPRSLHMSRPNPSIPWGELGVRVVGESTPLVGDPGALVGVSSFGISGTNAHLVLEGPPEVPSVPAEVPGPGPGRPHLFPFSAPTASGLRKTLQNWVAWLSRHELPALEDMAYTLGERRAHHGERLAVAASDAEDLRASIQAYLDGAGPPGVVDGNGETGGTGRVAFLFPGQGSQWTGMGRDLMDREPIFRQALEGCQEAMAPHVDWALLDQLARDPDHPEYLLDRIDVIQPALLAMEIALARLWRSWGVEPDAVVGHSMGEVAAAAVAGALSLDQAMRVICERSRLLLRTTGKGAMALVELDRATAARELEGLDGPVSIAVSNSPRSTVLSGDPGALQGLLARLESEGVFCRMIKVDVASHSPQMDALTGNLLAGLDDLRPVRASVPIHSTVEAARITGEEMDASYWVRNLRQPVLFSDVVQSLLADGVTTFIEMSPHPILLPAVEEGLRHRRVEGATIASTRRNEPELEEMFRGLARYFVAGGAPDWSRCNPARGDVVSLPLHPWEREEHWMDVAPGGSASGKVLGHPFLRSRTDTAPGGAVLEAEVGLEEAPFLADHRVRGRVLLPAAVLVDLALSAARRVLGPSASLLESFSFEEAVFPGGEGARRFQVVVTPEDPDSVRVEIFGRDGRSEDWVRHARGTVRAEGTGTTPSAAPSPIQTGEADTDVEDGETVARHYRSLEGCGLQYGAAFRSVRSSRAEDGGVVGTVRLPGDPAEAPAGFGIHPVLLDGGFQLLLTELLRESGSGYTRIPVSIDRLRLRGTPSTWAELTASARRDQDGGGRVGSVVLMGTDGTVVLEAEGVRFHPLPEPEYAAMARRHFRAGWAEVAPEEGEGEPGLWILFAEPSGASWDLVSQAAESLVASGARVVLVESGRDFEVRDGSRFRLDPSDPGHFRQLFQEVDVGGVRVGVVFGWGLPPSRTDGAPALDPDEVRDRWVRGPEALLHLVQALLGWEEAPRPRLWVLTRGAQEVELAGPAAAGARPEGDGLDPSPPFTRLGAGVDDPAGAALWGMMAVVSMEHPELDGVVVDLDPTDPSGMPATLGRELRSAARPDRVAVRHGRRFSPVLLPATPSEVLREEVVTVERGGREVARLETTAPGILDHLRLRASRRRRPGETEVEVAVQAAGLNFIDVLKAMGTYPGMAEGSRPALGAECAGRVAAVGTKIREWNEGDPVIVLSPSLDRFTLFSTRVIVSSEYLFPLPAGWSPEEGASFPIAFLTAHYGLFHLGRLEEGERVLIHSAAGGVGLAAVQLALNAGAEVFGTAGTPEKRRLLEGLGVRLASDSRSLDFAPEVLEATGGAGVDVVLNSLAGPALRRGLDVLAPHGRFVEIGKRDIHDDARIGLAPFSRNLTFASLDLAAAIERRPAVVLPMLRGLVDRAAKGELRPLPVASRPLVEAQGAFREMATGRHVGKLAVVVGDDPVPATRLERDRTLCPHRSYLITGGMGALGLLSARLLVSRGARHLALLGRSPPSPAAEDAIKAMRTEGVEILVLQADLADHGSALEAFRQIDEKLPSLAGVIHSAGVLADATLLRGDRAILSRTMAPKVRGGWNLHLLTRNRSLDFFVLYSSVSALLGIPGQAGYAAANAFLDALARYRRGLGLPGASVSWGPWKQVGLAAAEAVRGERLETRGLGGLAPEDGLAALRGLLGTGPPGIAIMELDARRWVEAHPGAARSGLLTPLLDLVEGQDDPSEGKRGASFKDELSELASPSARRGALQAFVRGEVARVLRLSAPRVPTDRALKLLGMDSLMGLELRNRLEAGLGLTLSATTIWNYPTVDLLTSFLVTELGLGSPATPGPARRETGPGDDPLNGDRRGEQPAMDDVEASLTEELRAVDELLGGA